MEKKKIPVALMIAAGILLYSNTVLAQSLPPTRETSQQQLSFDEALQLLHKGNQSLKIADKGIDIARAERESSMPSGCPACNRPVPLCTFPKRSK